MMRVTKAALVVLVAGLVGMSDNSAEAFWGHHRTTAAYAPVGVPVTAGYVPVAPLVVARPVVVGAPIIAASPIVTSGYAPAVAPVTSYYPPATTYYAPATPVIVRRPW